MKKASIGIIFSSDRKSVLVVKRNDVPVWVLPGGGIDDGEAPEKAVCRELLEETGLEAAVIRKVGHYLPANFLTKETHLFECRIVNNTPHTSSETLDVLFTPVESLPKPFFFLHKKWIDDALKNNREVIERKLTDVNVWNLFLHILRHPYLMGRYLFSRLGFPINTMSRK